MLILISYVILICSITFILMFIDKKKAIKGDFRIPESTFIKLSLLGGGIGTYMGMFTFKHKTLHKKFYIGIPLIIIFNIISIFILFNLLNL